ncbi:ArdC-like ssDNA-binding domain-containing protein, partial [Phocaeicola vulgatus]|nr:ArdC-like ssDNA-binding domain-containing protein [Phocaeicola vulgatus]MDB1003918.1 ArdC-like ssDNA-binding domain-containing protein [Phocaeicola vulgatus]MDC1605484.1 ArdC-like ssDNA-binding domain-containing protein [Phocaeicola vulgatus]MDC1628050.1 ArdC-like ssDNA-binding domain-containing protein [Phocaeicola vulgatus]
KFDKNSNYQINMKETDINKWATLMIEKMKEVHSSNWTKPWFTSRFKGFPQNLTGRSYNNQNKVVLYFICDKYKYKTPIFVTFNQARNERIQVLKGAKAFPISYYDLIIKDKIAGKRVTREFYKNLSPAEQEKYKVIPFLKYYNVFNLDQTNYSEVYPEKWNALVKEFGLNINSDNNFRNALLDSVIEKQTWICPITLKEQDGAFYSPSKDSITLPERYQFIDGKEFYYTALHEMAHSTGHPERLARIFGPFGSAEYVREELIAELSAAVAGRDLGMAVPPQKRECTVPRRMVF